MLHTSQSHSLMGRSPHLFGGVVTKLGELSVPLVLSQQADPPAPMRHFLKSGTKTAKNGLFLFWGVNVVQFSVYRLHLQALS